MKVTDIIEKTDELTGNILRRMMLDDCKNCDCNRCRKIVEAFEKRTPNETI